MIYTNVQYLKYFTLLCTVINLNNMPFIFVFLMQSIKGVCSFALIQIYRTDNESY